EPVCKEIPATKPVDARVCMREGDRHYVDCDDKNKCPPLYTCVKSTFCSLDTKAIANTAGAHFQVWLKVQPSDEDLKAKQKEVEKDIEELQSEILKLASQKDAKGDPVDNKPEIAAADDKIKDLQKKNDSLHTKEQTRGIITQMWIDSDQFKAALEYW